MTDTNYFRSDCSNPSLTNLLLRSVFLIIASAVPFLPQVVLAAPEAEVVHWWYRGGDREAVNILRDEFESRGGTWFDSSSSDMVAALDGAVSRMAKGYSPTLIQWNAGWEVNQFYKLGLLRSIEKPELDAHLRAKLLDSVVDNVSVDDRIVALPVNIHSENWVWLRRQQDAAAPKELGDWDQVFDYAKTIHSRDGVAIAMGADPWQRRLLFNSILVGALGAERYVRLYSDLDVQILNTNAFDHALNTFVDLQEYASMFGEGRWDQQVAAIASGEAQMVFMGDWAKGEFENLGLELDREFECRPVPTTANHLMLVIDAFVLGSVDFPSERQGQDLFIQVVTDEVTSVNFNRLKGSLPPLKNIDIQSMDSCNQIAHTALRDPEKVIPSFSSFGDRGFLGRLERIMSDLWDRKVSLESTRQLFRMELLSEVRKRSQMVTTVQVDD